MASQTWRVSTSGNVFDTQGNIVGTANGVGVVTITAAAVEVGPATDTLLVESGVTVKFPAGGVVNVRCSAAGNTFGTFRVSGDASNPSILTSSAASPAPGDWGGIRWIGAAAGDLTAPVVELTYCTVEYYQSIITQVAAGAVPQGFTATQCTFRRFSSVALSHQGGEGDTFPWNVSFCCFISCVGDGNVNQVQCIAGGLPAGGVRPLMVLNHCSFLYQSSTASDVFVLNCGSRSRMTLKNSIVVVTNPGAGQGNKLNLGPTAPVFSNNNNFYLSADSGLQEEYTPAGTDQNVDPEYFNTVCATANLSPNALVGSPDLYVSADDGSFAGAKEPYNIPSVVTAHRYWIHSGRSSHLLFVSGARIWMNPAGEAESNPNDPDTDVGWTVLRPGFITGVSACADVDTWAERGYLVASINVNGLLVFTGDSPFIEGVGTYKWSLHQATGIDSISPGDIIQMSMFGGNVPDGDGFTIQAEAIPLIVVELAFP